MSFLALAPSVIIPIKTADVRRARNFEETMSDALNVCTRCGEPLTVKQIQGRWKYVKRRQREGLPPPRLGPFCSPICTGRAVGDDLIARTNERHLSTKVP